jgi:hypothetical protein
VALGDQQIKIEGGLRVKRRWDACVTEGSLRDGEVVLEVDAGRSEPRPYKKKARWRREVAATKANSAGISDAGIFFGGLFCGGDFVDDGLGGGAGVGGDRLRGSRRRL